MGRHGYFLFVTRLLLAVGLVLVVAAPTFAEDPPKEDPELKQQAGQQEAPPAGSLAAAASKIKLQKPAEGEGGSVVITDKNVKKTGAGAAVSQGSGVTSSGAAPALGSAGSSPVASNANQLAEQVLAQKAKVDNMEAQLASYDEQLAAPSPDPRYPKYGDAPQFRSPGVMDPAQGKRDAYAEELENERAKLRDLEKKAQLAGVKKAAPVTENKTGGQKKR